MNNRIQLTEEQAREIVSIIEQDYDVIYIDEGVEKLKQAGYILKSELQQKVEEAEEVINQIGSIIKNCKHEERICLVWKDSKKLFEAFNLLKQSHPEFKK